MYSMKNLFPLLGDHKYSNGVRTIFGQPALVPNFQPKPFELQVILFKIFFPTLFPFKID